MLNPPISFLSAELLFNIVEHIAKLPSPEEELHNLSLVDRAFTLSCQSYIFRTLQLGGGSGSKSRISKKLKQMRRILNDKPSFADRVRTIEFHILPKHLVWFLNNKTLISILQLLAKSPMPPHEFYLSSPLDPLNLGGPIVWGRLAQSFFSQTLTILHLKCCENLPLSLFIICPRLREVELDSVEAAHESYNQWSDNNCPALESPALERFYYRNSQTLVKQMITPPSRYHMPLGLWSKLRVLTLSPHEREEMNLLQPILNAACNTLEELYLTGIQVGDSEQLPLAGIVNLRSVPRLHVFALLAIIKCDVREESTVIRDINIVLGTIDASNEITNLCFDFDIVGRQPFGRCLDEDWGGICEEVIRISAGKPLELNFEMWVSNGTLDVDHPGEGELYAHIRERTVSLSDYPNICTHLWDPTCWSLGLSPSLNRQVRSRCRR
ncbi:hypothetical protein B0H34DRAFT_668003 [Crassisporium funariophilum]|nr:hypothetical protein B0H34DRAFT_668003 [Crassisporium funariophilum]